MSSVAAILLVLSAFTHAGWNFISKKDHPSLAYYFVSNTIGVLCLLPIWMSYSDRVAQVRVFVWDCLVCSGFFLAAYMAALAGAYRAGDMSIAYPLARSLPAILVTAVTLILGLGKTVNLWFIIGVIFIVAGCMMLPMRTFHDFRLRNYNNFCCLLAVLAAACIAGYTMIDHEALGRLRSLTGHSFNQIDATLLYMFLEGVSTSVWKAVLVLISSRERERLYVVLRTYKRSAALTGIGIYLTYGLVLASMNFVDNVSYVAAFRQLSIPLGALLGMAFLKEPPCRPKIIGVVVIFAGLILAGTV
jgi:drug/metabolite transporter (DMT)-like permease